MKATAKMIQELEWHSMGKYPDELPIYPATADEIDIPAFECFLQMRKATFIESDLKALLYHYNTLTKEHTKTYTTM